MKELISEYGKAIIAAICTAAVISLLFISRVFNGNILNAAGDSAISMNEAELDESLAESSYNSVLSSMELDDKDIRTKTNLLSNEEYEVNSLVQSVSGKDRLSVKALSVKCVSGFFEGEDVTGQALKGDNIIFERAGIYSIKMRVENEKGQYLYGVMYYSVSEKEGVAA